MATIERPATVDESVSTSAHTTKTRKIALIGKAPSSVALAPYDDPDWEIWILNTLGNLREVPRWSRQFEMHDINLARAPEYGNYYQWLAQQTQPVFLRDEIPADFRGGIRYPLGDILSTFRCLAGRQYLTNTVSLMIALALHEHLHKRNTATGEPSPPISEMGLWGIDMAQHGMKSGHAGWFTSEYARQRPSCEYWIGVAEGMGITVTIPDTSDLLKTAQIYGYHTNDQWLKLRQRRKELDQRIAHAQQREQQAHDEALFLSGAREGLNYDEQWIATGHALTKPGKNGDGQ